LISEDSKIFVQCNPLSIDIAAFLLFEIMKTESPKTETECGSNLLYFRLQIISKELPLSSE
jgi:hypothetical protein